MPKQESVQVADADEVLQKEAGQEGPATVEGEIERLRRLNQARIQFINTAAHEFSTPLTPLRLQISLLREGKFGSLNPKQQGSVDVLERNIVRLSNLVQDVLDVSRLEANRFQIAREELDLSALVLDAVLPFTEAAKAAGVRFEHHIEPGLRAEADPDRISQVVVNLLSNALKFTPKGGKIVVYARRREEMNVVEVRDTGLGIKAEDFPRLFQPFSQLHDTATGPKNGSGLGLSISHGIVDQHGGRLWCDSQGHNKGSKFAFTLPFRAPSVATAMGVAMMGEAEIRRHVRPSGWTLFHFKCPECGTRDIELRLLRNRYECNVCTHVWR